MKSILPRSISVSLLAVFLTALSGIFGAPFFRALRLAYGRRLYFATGLLATGFFLAIKAYPFAILVCSVWMTLGAYTELEMKKLNWWLSGVIAIALGAVIVLGGTYGAIKTTGQIPSEVLMKTIQEIATQVGSANPQVKLDPQVLYQQVPSAAAIFITLVLAMGLIFEKRALYWMKLSKMTAATQLKLLDYRMPDFFIWLTMVAFLLTMVGEQWKVTAIIAINVVNISVVFYFFQGIAVLETLLISIRAGFFTRMLTYFLIVGQLVILVSAVGFFDYWLDFRKRIRNWKLKAPEEN
ncbi:MAG: DUF2232 domain-containing protein [Bdellovibrionia bacterium]